MKLVETALREISRGSFQKVVLARITQLQFSAPISPWPLLHKLLEATQETTIYGFQPSPHEAFIGATPENLYKRKGTTLLAESIAGTRKRGSSLQEDLLLERDLLASEKEQREFHFVKNFIEHQLSSVCQKSGNESVKVIKTARVQHLYHQYNGQLFHPIDDRDLMKLLHPTPAVGGFSREEALTFLKTHEPFDRGWYAGPIGWMSQEEAHIAVAIRSAHVQGSTLTLHAGTGIVSGSDPRKEWDELEWKIAQMMDLL